MRVGVALEDAPKLLQDLVLEILGHQPDITVFTIEVAGQGQLVTLLGTRQLDALIVSESGDLARAQHSELLPSHPQLKLLALSADGRSAKLYAAQRCLTLNSPSPGDLIRVLRGTDG